MKKKVNVKRKNVYQIYYNEEDGKYVEKPNCRFGYYFNNEIKQCEAKEECNDKEYFNKAEKNV